MFINADQNNKNKYDRENNVEVVVGQAASSINITSENFLVIVKRVDEFKKVNSPHDVAFQNSQVEIRVA